MQGGSYRAVQVSSPGKLELVERIVTEPPPGKVRIRVEACGVCHSDAVTVERRFANLQYPRVPGHEVIGKIDALGEGALGGAKVILATAASGRAMSPLIGGLLPGGRMVVVGVGGDSIDIPGPELVLASRSVQGALTGSAIDGEDTLSFSVLGNVSPMTETVPLALAAAAYARMMRGEARFRMVLVTDR